MKLPPVERLERIEAWGMSSVSASYVYRPTTVQGVVDAFREARSLGKTIAFRGGGNSYGDAFQNAEGIVVDFSRMNRILDWNPETGVVRCEPGVTIRELWRYTIGDGWWPPVVPGTSHVTIGGALAANIHGKNNFAAGTIGEHVLRFELLLPNGEVIECSRLRNEEVFHAAIGGFGLLGAIVSADILMKRIYSGLLNVEAIAVGNWRSAFGVFESKTDADYLVGWIDCFAPSGRGLIHAGYYKAPGEDPHPEESLRVDAQELPATILGWIPRSRVHRLMRPFVSRWGMRLLNSMKYRSARREHGKRYSQRLAEFNFLLDSLPGWKLAYRPGGLIQHQCFVPKQQAPHVFDEITRLSRARGLPPYLGVMKRHRPDGFLLSHSVDGYSLALDYPVTRKNREWLWKLCREMDEIALSAGGRFYFAKDSTLTPDAVHRAFGDDAIERFLELKLRLDPNGLLESELSKRINLWASSSAEPLAGRESWAGELEAVRPDEELDMPEPFWSEDR